MPAHSLGTELLDWAISGSGDFDITRLDRSSPALIDAFRYALGTPMDIAIVERIEELAKLLWPDVLKPASSSDTTEAIACGDFFSSLGFLFKYKSYGVKIASPFGYSIFNLEDGKGFSFQLHTKPKLEGFHVLKAKQRPLIYISSKEEWLDSGQQWARVYLSGDLRDGVDSPFAWRPRDGDVAEVSTTEVVHTALGCILEEYASCSVDAVERLFDQNAGSKVALPAAHPNIAAMLEQCRPGVPARRVERTSTGWQTTPWMDGDAAIKVDGDLWGSRVPLSSSSTRTLPAGGELVKVIIAVDGPLEVEISGNTRKVPHGSLVCAPPGLDVPLSPLNGDCSAAVHCVSRALIQADWSK